MYLSLVIDHLHIKKGLMEHFGCVCNDTNSRLLCTQQP